MDLFSKTYSINFSPLLLIIILVIVSSFAIFLYIYLKKLSNKRKVAKTGFLGKPLYQLSLIVVVLSIAVGSYFLSTSDIELVSEAKQDVKTDIEYQIV